MTPKAEYVEQQMKDCREIWFKNHKAVFITNDHEQVGGAVVIAWQQPESWNYGCRFIIHRRWLCVVGDIGEATFEWSSDITLNFLAGIDLHYFLGKCRASDSGRDFAQWDAKVADAYRDMRIKELKETPDEDKSEDDAKELEILEGNEDCSENEWKKSAQEYYDETGDAEGAGSMSDFGKVPSVHAIGMFIGLQMAIAQLKEQTP